MKKKSAITATIIIMALSVGMVSQASENTPKTAAKLKSEGAVIFQDKSDSVVIDSADLYMLADRIDSFKTAVANQLGALHTYLTTDGRGIALTTDENIRVVHSNPTEQADPLEVDFDTLLEGLAASQSIPLEPAEYGYEDGVKLYRTGEGRLTADASAEGAQEIGIAAATADNLTAGTAAWVDGELLLGTGADNQVYYQLGSGSYSVQSINGSGPIWNKTSGGNVVTRTYTLKKGYLYLTLIAGVYNHSSCYVNGNASINGENINFTTVYNKIDNNAEDGYVGLYQYSGFMPVNEGDILTIEFENYQTNITNCSYGYNGINIY